MQNFEIQAQSGLVCGWIWGREHHPLGLIFLHANGFNALTYRTILEEVAEESQHRILAVDLRGHGRSEIGGDPARLVSWDIFAADIVDLVDALWADRSGPTLAPSLVLAGHSMGATSALLAAAKMSARVKSLVLLDPVIFPPVFYRFFDLPFWGARITGSIPIARQARSRRREFVSRNDAFSVYKGRGAFRDWPDAMLRDYLQDGLRDNKTGFELACPPGWEAAIYSAQAADPWQAVRRYEGFARILYAEQNSTLIRPGKLRRRRPDWRIEAVKGTHFFPMTSAAFVTNALSQAVIGR